MKKLITIILLFFMFQPITNAINIEVSDEVLDLTNFYYYGNDNNNGIDIDYGSSINLINQLSNYNLIHEGDNNSYTGIFTTTRQNEIYNYLVKILGNEKLEYLINNGYIVGKINSTNNYFNTIGNAISLNNESEITLKNMDKLYSKKIYQFSSEEDIKNYNIRIYLKPIKNYFWNKLGDYNSNIKTKLLYFNDETLPQHIYANMSPDNTNTVIGKKGYILKKYKYTQFSSGKNEYIYEIIPFIDFKVNITKGNNIFILNYFNYISNLYNGNDSDNLDKQGRLYYEFGN